MKVALISRLDGPEGAEPETAGNEVVGTKVVGPEVAGPEVAVSRVAMSDVAWVAMINPGITLLQLPIHPIFVFVETNQI